MSIPSVMDSYTFTARERKILEAAAQVFVRYGVKRTSMGDIAEEAGVARQTLYNVYNSKDDVFRAALNLFHQTMMAGLMDALEEADTLQERMDIVLEHTILAPYRQLQALPHGDEFEEGFNTVGKAAIEDGQTAIRHVVADILTPYTKALKSKNMEPVGLADFLVRSAKAAKMTAKDEAHLKALLGNMKALVSNAVE